MLSIAICRKSGDNWQSKTLFLTIFYLLSSIVLKFWKAAYPLYFEYSCREGPPKTSHMHSLIWASTDGIRDILSYQFVWVSKWPIFLAKHSWLSAHIIPTLRKNSFRNTIGMSHSLDQQQDRCCQSWSEYKRFAKVICRWQKLSPLLVYVTICQTVCMQIPLRFYLNTHLFW